MNITKINIFKNDDESSKVKAYVNIVLNDCFAVKDIKIIEGEQRLFVSMPSKKIDNGYMDIAHPINQDTREMIENKILSAYNNN